MLLTVKLCKMGTAGSTMKVKVIVHEAEEGGYWTEVPAIPGCATQGDSLEELMKNVREAVEACLRVEAEEPRLAAKDRLLEIVG